MESFPKNMQPITKTQMGENEELLTRKLRAQKGDIVTVKLDMHLNEDVAIEPLFDMKGELSFVLGYGNYLPELHTIIENMSPGESVMGAKVNAGWGEINPDLVVKMKIEDVKARLDISQLKVGKSLYLKSGASCVIKEVTEEYFTIDANYPLAGASYACNLKLLNVEKTPSPFLSVYCKDDEKKPRIASDSFNGENHFEPDHESRYEVATFALGCFWGGELQYMREIGVVGTKVGYTQGAISKPSYNDVCEGTTGHTEAIMVVYDPKIVTYEKLVKIATDRLGDDIYLENQVGYDKGNQYRHGIYFHTEEQKRVAEKVLKRFGDGVKTELKPASLFHDAEEYHQQYLLKGGQSAKKNASEHIRCYG